MVKQTEITIPLLIAHGYWPHNEDERVNNLGAADPDGKLTLHYGGNGNLWVMFDNDLDEWLILIDGQVYRRLLSWEQFQSLHLGVVGKALVPVTPESPRYVQVVKKMTEWCNRFNDYGIHIELTITKTGKRNGNN